MHFCQTHTGLRRNSTIMYAAPTLKKYLYKTQLFFHNILLVNKKQTIGDNVINGRNAVLTTFPARKAGSLTVEASLVLPVFLGAMLLLSGLFSALMVYDQVDHYLCQVVRKEAQNSISEKGPTQSSLLGLYAAGMGESGIDYTKIVGGKAGIVLKLSSEDQAGMEVTAAYSIRIPGFLMSSHVMVVTNRVCFRAFNGQPLEGMTGYGSEGAENESKVYVAATGTVYHTSDSCTYLKLSIHEVAYASLDQQRNDDGGKYYACEYCGKNAHGSTVYITDDGTAWHTDRNCSGLKRTLQVMSSEEAAEKGLHVCSRCGGD